MTSSRACNISMECFEPYSSHRQHCCLLCCPRVHWCCLSGCSARPFTDRGTTSCSGGRIVPRSYRASRACKISGSIGSAATITSMVVGSRVVMVACAVAEQLSATAIAQLRVRCIATVPIICSSTWHSPCPRHTHPTSATSATTTVATVTTAPWSKCWIAIPMRPIHRVAGGGAPVGGGGVGSVGCRWCGRWGECRCACYHRA
jgi:hypothetical protein